MCSIKDHVSCLKHCLKIKIMRTAYSDPRTAMPNTVGYNNSRYRPILCSTGFQLSLTHETLSRLLRGSKEAVHELLHRAADAEARQTTWVHRKYQNGFQAMPLPRKPSMRAWVKIAKLIMAGFVPVKHVPWQMQARSSTKCVPM